MSGIFYWDTVYVSFFLNRGATTGARGPAGGPQGLRRGREELVELKVSNAMKLAFKNKEDVSSF